MRIALEAKNKMAFIDGSVSRPDESHPLYRIWIRCNSMVKSWILNSVSKQIYGSILRFNDASDIWKDLLTRFHITNLPRSYQLTQQIWSLHQGSVDLGTYYTKLKTLWDELDGADCAATCHNCKCCKVMDTMAENAKIIKFLAGLNESYSQIRSQIIMKKNIPDFAEVYNILDQDHSQRNIGQVLSSPASAFQVSAPIAEPLPIPASINAAQGSYNNSKHTNRPICSHCGYNGHTVDKCYKIHGYPPSFKHRQRFSYEKAPNPVQFSHPKPVVAQLALTDTSTSPQSPMINNISEMVGSLSKNQIQDVIAYFSSHLPTPTSACVASSSGNGNAANGSYRGIDDWSG